MEFYPQSCRLREAGFHEVVWMTSLWGIMGVAGTLPWLLVKRAAVCAWFGVGGEARLQVQRVGCQGRAIAPWLDGKVPR
jgi:hypothetical protein